MSFATCFFGDALEVATIGQTSEEQTDLFAEDEIEIDDFARDEDEADAPLQHTRIIHCVGIDFIGPS